MKEGGTWEGKRSGGREKANKKRRMGMHLHAILFSFAFWHQTYIPVALSGLNQ